jgi:hypothetical protein
MLEFDNLLQEIKKRPTLYLAKHSIFDFQSFYNGYGFARYQMGLVPTEQEKEFEEFLQWIPSVYPVKTRQTWAHIILFHSADERDALDKLFVLLERFKKLSQKTGDSKKKFEDFLAVFSEA